ncbi:MAG: sulfatase-like hydrolase/transferase [Deltaproteobacteria bacterium]|nr:sulfatase-like hydrolase/transferase [Deltaproteobacteria bacterium]
MPIVPPPEYKKRFAALDYDGPDYVRDGNPNPIAVAIDDAIQSQKPRPEFPPVDVQHLMDLYDDEIGSLDEELAVLLADLEKRGLLERTIVVLAADNGEQFLEHGFLKHGYTLYDTDIHTPLAWRIPGVGPGEISAPVQNLDLVPTLLDYLGVRLDSLALEGRSLRGLIEGTSSGARRWHLCLRHAGPQTRRRRRPLQAPLQCADEAVRARRSARRPGRARRCAGAQPGGFSAPAAAPERVGDEDGARQTGGVGARRPGSAGAPARPRLSALIRSPGRRPRLISNCYHRLRTPRKDPVWRRHDRPCGSLGLPENTRE